MLIVADHRLLIIVWLFLNKLVSFWSSDCFVRCLFVNGL